MYAFSYACISRFIALVTLTLISMYALYLNILKIAYTCIPKVCESSLSKVRAGTKRSETDIQTHTHTDATERITNLI